MYLYSTTARAGAANPTKVIEWAVNLTQKINQISEIPTSLWTAAMSPGMGTLAWTSLVEDLAVIEATETKLAADSGYQSLVDEAVGLLSTDPVDQTLMQIVHADPDRARIDAAYVSIVRAVMAPGALVAGVELGVELAQRAKQVTGCPTSFGVASTGPYGGVCWITACESIQQLQRAGEALNGSIEFARLVDEKARTTYLPGATQVVARKIV